MRNGIISVSFEVCIRAKNELTARQYAALHNLDVTKCKWSHDHDGESGRLYASDTEIHRAGAPSAQDIEKINKNGAAGMSKPCLTIPSPAWQRTASHIEGQKQNN